MEPKKRVNSYSSSTSEPHSRSHKKEASHYSWQEGDLIAGKYKIIDFLGDGTFGRVLEVEDTEGCRKAMKVVRAVDRYVEAAKIEAQILREVNQADPTHQSHIVRLFEDFPMGDNYCLVFEKLGRSLFDVIKLNKFRGKT